MMSREQILEITDPDGTFRARYEADRQQQKQAATVEAAPPRVVVPPPWRPFPLDVLPEACRQFIAGTAAHIGCDESFVALPLLSVLAGAIGNARTIRLKPGWEEPAILWTAIVGESGTMKSPAIESVLRPVWRREERAYQDYEREREEYGEVSSLHRQETAAWVKGTITRKPPDLDRREPVCRRTLVTDPSPRELAADLHQNPRGLTLVQDELSGWLGHFQGTGRGRSDGAADWLNAFGARPWIVEPKGKTRPVIFVRRATLSLTGGIQPEVLRQALQRMGNNGVAARLLLAHPPYRPKTWTAAEASGPGSTDALEAGLSDLLARLEGLAGIAPAPRKAESELDALVRSLKVGVEHPQPPRWEGEPRALPLSAEAEAVWIAFFQQHTAEQEDLTGDLAAAWSKLEAYAARLSLVIHVVRGVCGAADPDVIDADSLRAGIALAEWFGNEVLRFYALFATCEHAAAKQRLVALIERRRGEITVRQLVQSDRRFRGNYVRAEIVLNELVETGLGNWVFRPGPGRCGKWVFRLHGAPDTGGAPPPRIRPVVESPPDPEDEPRGVDTSGVDT